MVDPAGKHLLVIGEANSTGDHFTWDPAMNTMELQLIDGQQKFHPVTRSIDRDQLSLLFVGDSQPSGVVTLRLPELFFRITSSQGKETSITIAGPFDVAFRFPDQQASFAPTPRVINNPVPTSLTPTPNP
jgi:hypothetical protein